MRVIVDTNFWVNYVLTGLKSPLRTVLADERIDLQGMWPCPLELL